MIRKSIQRKKGELEPIESIYETLRRLGLARDETRKFFSAHTRDVKNLTVYRDELSGVIFIDGHYVGNQIYESGAYRSQTKPNIVKNVPDLEDCMDSQRRFDRYQQFFVGKDVCDFGCGQGSFLRMARPYAKSVMGVELQKDCSDRLNGESIPCVRSINEVQLSLDSVFMFHAFEHFPNPSQILKAVRSKLKAGGVGRVVIEVPHARDFLIEQLACEEFIKFTLWSQHLILHTRESLRAFLRDAGFGSITIEGVQRYGIANHLHWLRHNMPGGHKANLSVLETSSLKSAYADALSKLDASDTLVAIAST